LRFCDGFAVGIDTTADAGAVPAAGAGVSATDRDGAAVEALCSADCRPDFCALVQSGAEGRRRCLAERHRAVEIAAETGQSFITICHAGIVLVCVPVLEKASVSGSR